MADKQALDLLIESVIKKRFAMGSRKDAAAQSRGTMSRKASRTTDGWGSRVTPKKGASREPDGAPSQSIPSQHAPSQSAPSQRGQSQRSSNRIAQSQSESGPEQEATGRREGATPSRAGGVAATAPPAFARTGRRSRYIPAAVRRLVAERDGLQCTYIGPDGRRCERRDVELHHLRPFARGGQHSAEQITLRCRAHNAFQAELDYGTEHIKRRVRQRRARSTQRRTASARPARPPADAAR